MNLPINPPPDDRNRSAYADVHVTECNAEAAGPVIDRDDKDGKTHSFLWAGPACPSLGAWSGASCGARVTHNWPGLSIASSVGASGQRVAGLRYSVYDMISRLGTAGWEDAGRETRTVLATPGHCEDRHADARSRRSSCVRDRRGTGVLTLGSGVLPLSASVRTRVISRPE